MKKKYFFLEKLTTFKLTLALLAFSSFCANATELKTLGAIVTTNSGSGLAASYPSLEDAITALNAATITSPVVINLNAPQIAPAGGYAITASGTAVNTIILNGNNNIVSANATLTVGAINDAIFKLVGADYITLSGFTMIENPANTISATALTNNMTEWGVALLYATTTNGAQNNTIIDNTITLNRTYTNTFGIYSNSMHSATNVGTSATATTAAGGNTGLSVLGNTISNVNLGIVVVGPSAAADHNQSLTIGSAAEPNFITDFATGAPLSTYNSVSATSYGILVRNTANFDVSYNTITSSNGGYTGASAFRGIYIPSFSNAPTGTLTQTLNNNTISLRPAASVAITGIGVEATTGNATTSLSISNNDFNNSTHTITASAAIFFINNASAVLNTTINGNTFTNLSVNTTGSVTIIGNNVTRPANSVVNANNNAIVTGFAKTGAGGTLTFYNSNSVTPGATSSETNTGNNFSNISVTGATTVAGWVCSDGPTSTPYGPTKTFTNNTFTNILGGTSAMTIVSAGYGLATGNSIVSGNTVNNISSASTIIGLTSLQGKQNITGNTITNITSTVSGIVSGLVIGNGNDQTVTKNKIASIEVNNAGGLVNGILISNGLLVNITNNIIGDLRSPLRTGATDGVRGISSTSTAANSSINIYNNTIALAAVSTGAEFSTSGIFHTTNATATTAALDMRNNLVVNASVANGAGTSAAFRRSSTALANFAATSNRNDFVAPVIFADGTAAAANIAAYQAIVTPREANSITAIPTFLSITPANANFLHLDPSVFSPIESGGSSIASVVDDFDGNIRQGVMGYTGTGTAPDIGADEFEGVLSNVDFDETGFTVYPNPTAGILNINATKMITEVSVINMLGQTVMNKKMNDLDVQIDLSSLSRATYLVKVVAEGQEKVLKVLKQ